MPKYISSPFPEINGETPASIFNWIYANTDGRVAFLPSHGGKSQPILQIGGQEDSIISSADSETEGTLDKTYHKEGARTNPLSLFPSSFFTPIPPWISSILPGPLSIISNPNLLVAIIAITLAARGSEDTYTRNRIELPLKVIDNQDLENKLFEEQ